RRNVGQFLGVELAFVDRDLPERIHDADLNAELVAQDRVEVQHSRAASGEHDLIDPIRARSGGEEVESLAKLAGEVLRDGVEDGDDLLDGVVADRLAALEILGLVERKAQLAPPGRGARTAG